MNAQMDAPRVENWTRADKIHQPPVTETDRLWLGIGWGFVALGTLLRLDRWLLGFPLWIDESRLAVSVFERDLVALLSEPLAYKQLAPPGFLALEWLATRALGFNEWVLRLIPLLASIVALLLMRGLAFQLIGGAGAALAVGLLSVSWWPIRFGSEVKPYALDLLVSLALLALAARWLLDPSRPRPLWLLSVVGPLGLTLSFPALLTAGAVGLVLMAAALGSACLPRRIFVLVALGLFAVTILATFGFLLPYYAPEPSDAAFYYDLYWSKAFPPWDQPAKLPGWLLEVHTDEGFHYPVQFPGLGGGLTFTLVCVGILAWLGRLGWPLCVSRQSSSNSTAGSVLVLILGPFAMGLIAAGLKRYPYGEHIRTMQYLAGPICLLAGLGLRCLLVEAERRAGLLPRFARWVPTADHASVGVCGLFVLFGLISHGVDLVRPARVPADQHRRDFARWFWVEQERAGVVVCPHTDLGLIFRPGHWQTAFTEEYLCYRMLYAPRFNRGLPPDWESLSSERPLRVVFFNENPEERPVSANWLAEMNHRWDFRGVWEYVVSDDMKRPFGRDPARHVYRVYEYAPPPGVDPAALVDEQFRSDQKLRAQLAEMFREHPFGPPDWVRRRLERVLNQPIPNLRRPF